MGSRSYLVHWVWIQLITWRKRTGSTNQVPTRVKGTCPFTLLYERSYRLSVKDDLHIYFRKFWPGRRRSSGVLLSDGFLSGLRVSCLESLPFPLGSKVTVNTRRRSSIWILVLIENSRTITEFRGKKKLVKKKLVIRQSNVTFSGLPMCIVPTSTDYSPKPPRSSLWVYYEPLGTKMKIRSSGLSDIWYLFYETSSPTRTFV